MDSNLSTKDKINVIFLGAGNIAVPIVEKLVTLENVNLLDIGTQLDQPAGRKRKLHQHLWQSGVKHINKPSQNMKM